MVFVTGDCHADFIKFSSDRFKEQRNLTLNDIVIVCGDFGIWHDDGEERYWLKWLNKKQFTTVFVDGNHENFDRLNSCEFETVEFHGGTAHKIRDNIYHLMRGQIYNFEGKLFWCFGGASSHDISDGILDIDDFDSIYDYRSTINKWNIERKMFRINHISWWKEEMPSQEEMDFGKDMLASKCNEVDYIITHCCPQEISSFLGFHDPDELTMYFNDIAHTTKFTRWYFGHYHMENVIFGKFIVLYDRIERII